MAAYIMVGMMDSLYYTIFFMLLPIACFFTNFAVAIASLLGKNNQRKGESKRQLIVGSLGGIAGYLIALLYFYLTRDEAFSSILEMSCIGFLIGAGYVMIAFSFMPINLRLKGIDIIKVYRLAVDHVDKHLFYLLLTTLVFLALKLFVDIVLARYLGYLFPALFSGAKLERGFVGYDPLFIIVSCMQTLLIYAFFGYLIRSRYPASRVKEMVVIASLFTFLLMLFIYYGQSVYIKDMFLKVVPVSHYIAPLIGLFIGNTIRKQLVSISSLRELPLKYYISTVWFCVIIAILRRNAHKKVPFHKKPDSRHP